MTKCSRSRTLFQPTRGNVTLRAPCRYTLRSATWRRLNAPSSAKMPTAVTMSRYYASPLWPCNAATADVAPHYVPTNQRSPHVALAMPYSANLRSDQSAFATRRSGNAVLRQFPLQPISIRHTPFWQCRTPPFVFPPTSARYAPRLSRRPLPFHSAARATVRDKRQFPFRGSCQFQEHSSRHPVADPR